MNTKLLTLIGSLVAALSSSVLAQEPVKFVDASAANTTGSAFVTTANIYNDNLWSIRTVGSGNSDVVGNTAFEAGPHGGSENVPVIATTITGLTPGASYETYVYFVTFPTSDGSQLWRIRAGLASDLLNAYDRNSASTSVLAEGSTTALADPAGNPITVPTNRDYRQASLGIALADGSGNLTIHVDAGTGTADQNHRTWYDGVGYKSVSGSTGSISPITVDPANAMTGTFATEWNTDSNLENWTLSQATGTVSGGGLQGTATGTDSRVSLSNFASGPDLDLGWNDFLELRILVPASYGGGNPDFLRHDDDHRLLVKPRPYDSGGRHSEGRCVSYVSFGSRVGGVLARNAARFADRSGGRHGDERNGFCH